MPSRRPPSAAPRGRNRDATILARDLRLACAIARSRVTRSTAMPLFYDSGQLAPPTFSLPPVRGWCLPSVRKIIAILLCIALVFVAASGWARAEWSAESARSRAITASPTQPSLAQSQSQPPYTPSKRGAPDYRESGATRDLSAQRRVALVIGNGAYQYLPRLANPVNDAKLIAKTLQSVGFRLIGGRAQTDLDRASFEHAVRQFGEELADGSVGLFYYAGHGLQWRGNNYLVPVGANPESTADVDFELVNAQVVLDQMELAGSKLDIVILDACRNNPFGGRGLRDAGGGLAQMQAPRGTLISYATQPGNVALDGDAGDSPYAAALAEVIRRPGLPILEVFNQVGVTVDQTTGGRQEPWVSHSPLEGTFYFLGPTTVNITPATPSHDAEIVFWQSIENSKTAGDFEEYLKKIPTGTVRRPRAQPPRRVATQSRGAAADSTAT
jgi:Caspase domain